MDQPRGCIEAWSTEAPREETPGPEPTLSLRLAELLRPLSYEELGKRFTHYCPIGSFMAHAVYVAHLMN